jgi:hypothetical protein
MTRCANVCHSGGCIYCGIGGPFSDEHVVSAGLGGDDDEWLLKGCVCRACNTDVFSKLEMKAQRTLAGDAVEADRIDGVDSGDMPRLLVFWREEGELVSGGSGPPAFAMELTLVVQALVEQAAHAGAVRDLDIITYRRSRRSPHQPH